MTVRALDFTAEEHHSEKEFGPLNLPPHYCDEWPNDCGICRMREQMYAHYNKARLEYQMACRADRGEWTPHQARTLAL